MNDIRIDRLSIGTVLYDIDFVLPAGGCLGVVGVNGVGKSTLLGCLAGVLRPDRGRVTGTKGAPYLPEGCPLDPGISVAGWLQMARHLPGWDPEVADAMIRDLDLPLKTHADRLSLGQRVRLGVLLTLGRKAPVYLLDDPFLGLDPVVRGRVEAEIARRGAEATVVIAAQALEPLERLCTHLMLLDAGRVRVAETMDRWRERFCAVWTSNDVRIDGEPGVLDRQERGARVRWVLDDPDGRLRERIGGTEDARLGLEEVLGRLVQ